jgi:hypothetical protein
MTTARYLRADLANGFANTGHGRLRTRVDQATAYDPSEQACPTNTDWSGRRESLLWIRRSVPRCMFDRAVNGVS